MNHIITPYIDPNEHLDHIIRLSQVINHKEITLLTGLNGSGKSLIRKLMVHILHESLGRRPKLLHVSQELRTASKSEFGALSSALHDLEWLATSVNTLHLLENVFTYQGIDYLVLDEPEMGICEELQLSLGDWLNQELKDKDYGTLIICHSRLLVSLLDVHTFINIEGMNKDQWLNRTPIKYPIDTFKSNAEALQQVIQDRHNKHKAHKESINKSSKTNTKGKSKSK